MDSAEPVRYWIDAADRIAGVNDAWETFASDNNGHHLLQAEILGRRLWDFISDSGTRQVYQTIVSRVRRGGGLVRFSFRCDAPQKRRLLQMEISANPHGRILFEVSRPVSESRASAPLLSEVEATTEPMLRMCGWCKRLAMPDGSFAEAEKVIAALNLFESPRLPPISHGMCGACAENWSKSLSNEVVGWLGAGESPQS